MMKRIVKFAVIPALLVLGTLCAAPSIGARIPARQLGSASARGGRNSSPILVVDGDSASREVVSQLLLQAGHTCREAATGEEALAAAREEEPALVILSVAVPGVAGYDVCRTLREEFGEILPIIFTSKARTDPLDCVAGLLLGADDYIVEPFVRAEFVARVRRAVIRSVALRSLQRRPTHTLTAREVEVLAALADGLSQQQIALMFVISPKTVATHIQRILAKLEVHSRAEAVAAAYQRGIVERTDSRADVSALVGQ
jgi:DNA-binding NarL/FixJ family response regulator